MGESYPENVENYATEIAENSRPLQDFSFDELDAMEGTEILGATLTPKDDLIGIPIMIVEFTFRQSDVSEREYVSVIGKTRLDTVVFNDGSTGIRDQLVSWCIRSDVFKENAANPTVALRENLADKLPDYVEIDYDTAGNWFMTVTLSAPIKSRHGLRKSEYASREIDGRKIPAGVTYYLA